MAAAVLKKKDISACEAGRFSLPFMKNSQAPVIIGTTEGGFFKRFYSNISFENNCGSMSPFL